LKELFSGKKELFRGLYIEDKIEWQSHAVLHFDFSSMDFRGKGLERAIYDRLSGIAETYRIVLEEKTIGSLFAELMRSLHEKTGKQVVILIDEYDKPITDVLEVGENKKAHENRDILRTFYSVVKGNSAHIRFFFLTGIARFSKVSLFSDLNNLTDLSKESDYHNLLGCTQGELTQYFLPHLNFIAEEKNISLDELLAQIKDWYNGFSWNGKDKLYNPYSILRFLSARNFNNYWFESGTPKFLIELLKKENVYDLSGIEVDVAETENIDIDNLGLITLFFQTGYLTVREAGKYGLLILDYPNKEVEESMLKHILAAYAGSMREVSLSYKIAQALENNNFKDLQKAFNTLFAAIPYQIFDNNQEKYFHAIVFLALKLCGFFVQAELNMSNGRADAVIFLENRIYIFEFKLNQSAEEAIRQIHERGYYKQFLGQGKEIYLVGINFSGKTKSVQELSTEQLS
jgi:hypothetical protein